MFLLGVLGELSAQPEIKRMHYTRQDGLPSNAISDILSDSRGYMWFSTREGLNFVNYTTGAKSNIPYLHNRIDRIYEDKFGNIWMMMYDGKFFRLNRKTDNFESLINHFPNSIEARIESPLFTSNSSIWAIIQNAGLLEIETDSLSNRMTIRFHPLENIEVHQLYEDSLSTIWATTSKGVRVLKSDTLSIKQYEKKRGGIGYHTVGRLHLLGNSRWQPYLNTTMPTGY